MSQCLSKTEQRVAQHTDPAVNEKLRRDIEARIYYYSQRIEDIQQRLDELESEWDIERVFETQASGLILISTFLGITVSRKLFLFPAIVAGFLLQHAISGWCPPVPVLRKLGIRTTREINHERFALKALRGDFDDINSKRDESPQQKAAKAMTATEVV